MYVLHEKFRRIPNSTGVVQKFSITRGWIERTLPSRAGVRPVRAGGA